MSIVIAPAALTYREVADFVVKTIAAIDLPQDSPASSNRASTGGRRLDVDLAPLNRFDSSALAAMVSLARSATIRNVELRFLSVSANLRKLATLYAVDNLLFGD